MTFNQRLFWAGYRRRGDQRVCPGSQPIECEQSIKRETGSRQPDGWNSLAASVSATLPLRPYGAVDFKSNG